MPDQKDDPLSLRRRSPSPDKHPEAHGRPMFLRVEERPHDRMDRPGPGLTLIRLPGATPGLYWASRDDVFSIENVPLDLPAPIPGATYASPFALDEKVIIDGNEDLWGRVTAISWREALPQIEVSWWNERQLTSAWVSPSRLSRPEKP